MRRAVETFGRDLCGVRDPRTALETFGRDLCGVGDPRTAGGSFGRGVCVRSESDVHHRVIRTLHMLGLLAECVRASVVSHLASFSSIACLVLIVSSLAFPATAASLNARLNEARALLESGDPAAALERYTELLVEEPESEAALLGLACAKYRQAENALNAEDKEQARTLFEEARGKFVDLANAKTRATRAAAAFDNANISARLAKMDLAKAEQDPKLRKEAIEALRDAVRAYENVLLDFPEQPGAQQNLDHMRYLLKLELQKEEEQPPQMGMFSGISNPQTDLPGATVEVLPRQVSEDGALDADSDELPPGNTAILKRPSGEETTP